MNKNILLISSLAVLGLTLLATSNFITDELAKNSSTASIARQHCQGLVEAESSIHTLHSSLFSSKDSNCDHLAKQVTKLETSWNSAVRDLECTEKLSEEARTLYAEIILYPGDFC